MRWTWQDEAWRLYENMGAVTYSPARLMNAYLRIQSAQTPPDEDDGGTGVREPRRPLPQAPAGFMALSL